MVKRMILAVALLAACDREASTDGPKVFAAYCSMCHGSTGQPPAEMVARLNVRDLTSRELRARVSPELVEAQVRTGSKNGLMPSFVGTISNAQIKAVSAWVASPAFVAPR